MNKVVSSLVIVAVLAAALGTTGVAFAQGQQPPAPQNPGSGNGGGMRYGMRGGMMGNRAAGAQTGFLHVEMVAALAEKLGLTVDELNARLAGGETVAQIALAQGSTLEEFQTLMAEARAQALDQAVANGKLTQEQADWMKQHGFGMFSGRGAGQGRYASSNCPYYDQANP